MSGTDKCPPKTDLEKSAALPDGLDKTMKAMGVESCKTTADKDEYNWATSAEMDILGGLGGSVSVGASGGGMKTSNTSVGCEQITAISKISVDVTDKIKCTLQENILEISQNVKAYNSLKLKAGKSLMMDCGKDGLQIDQQNQIKLKASISFSDQQISQVESTIKDGLKQTTDVIKSSTTGWGATPEGSKYIEETQEKIVKGEYDANIKKNIMTVSQMVTSGNEILMEAGGDIFIKGSSCKISQSNFVDLVAEIMYSNSMNDVFKEYYEKVREYDSKVSQTSDSAGAPTLPPAEFLNSSSKTTKYIIGGIIIFFLLLCCGICSYFLMKR